MRLFSNAAVFGRYVIVYAICHVRLNVRIKVKKDNIESLRRLWSDQPVASRFSSRVSAFCPSLVFPNFSGNLNYKGTVRLCSHLVPGAK